MSARQKRCGVNRSTHRTLVYGGARKGLMEVLAQSVKRHGGRIYGMVPDILQERGWVSDTLDVTFRCVDLTDRKAMMNRESDVLVALPGGMGNTRRSVYRPCQYGNWHLSPTGGISTT